MTNQDMLHNIEYLRERANVSYEEAATILDHNDGDVVRALMVLEQQGRLFRQTPTSSQSETQQEPWQKEARQATEKAKTFIEKAFNHRVVIERTNKDGQNETVLNVSAPIAVGAAIVAPYLAVASAAVTAVTGCKVKIKGDEKEQ